MINNNLNCSKMSIYLFGLKLGLFSIFKKDFYIGVKRLILPVNYWRVSIFNIVCKFILNEFNNKKNMKILDIGSPKLLALYLAKKTNCLLYATDLSDPALFKEWNRYYKNITNKSNLIFNYANAKSLPYPDNYFDIVYSLSVIHMITPGSYGDIIAVKEIVKKVKSNGIFIIEVPYRTKYSEIYAHKSNFEEVYTGKPLFQERQYDEEALKDRIEKNIPGILIKKVYLYELLQIDSMWWKLPKLIRDLFSPIEAWLDIFNIKIAIKKEQIKKAKSVILFFKISK